MNTSNDANELINSILDREVSEGIPQFCHISESEYMLINKSGQMGNLMSALQAKHHISIFIKIEMNGNVNFSHITPAQNVENIKRKGLLASCSSKEYTTYGNGNYCFKNSNDWIEDLVRFRKNDLLGYSDDDLHVVTGSYDGTYFYFYRDNSGGLKRFLFFNENLAVEEITSYLHFVETVKDHIKDSDSEGY